MRGRRLEGPEVFGPHPSPPPQAGEGVSESPPPRTGGGVGRGGRATLPLPLLLLVVAFLLLPRRWRLALLLTRLGIWRRHGMQRSRLGSRSRLFDGSSRGCRFGTPLLRRRPRCRRAWSFLTRWVHP